MRLSDVLTRLAKHGLAKVGTWKLPVQGRIKTGITIGDPSKFFPYSTGPQYPVETTDDKDPELDDEVIKAIERRFGHKITP
jgi:hypothetical protein